MKDLNLQMLEDESATGLSHRYGGFLAEAASVCLNHHKHGIQTTFPVEGYITETYGLNRLDISAHVIDSFSDLEEATEYGAMGIAVMIIYNQTGWKARRSYKGTGFDFWFGDLDKDFLFQNKLRVEVSGDLKGTDKEISDRLKKKLEQPRKSDHLKIPACAVVVEFSNPKSLTGQR